MQKTKAADRKVCQRPALWQKTKKRYFSWPV